MPAIKLAAATFVLLALAGCNTSLPSGTMVERGGPVYAPPPAYAPPPRCFIQDGPYGPERICRSY